MTDTLRAAPEKTVRERPYFDRRDVRAQLGVG